MSSNLRSFEETALATGRFEMFLSPAPPLQAYKSLLEIDKAGEIGLFNAKSIIAYQSADCSKATEKALDSAGIRDGNRWILETPVGNQSVLKWKKVLASDAVLDFSGYEEDSVQNLIRQLFLPVVHALPLAALEGPWIASTKKAMKAAKNELHVAIGGAKGKVCFVGLGTNYKSAVAAAAQIPGYLYGYPESDFQEIIKSKRILHPIK